MYNAKTTNSTFGTGTVFVVGRSHKKSAHHMAVYGFLQKEKESVKAHVLSVSPS